MHPLRRPDPVSLATDARRIGRQMAQCDALTGKLREAEEIARSLRQTTDGEPERSMIDALNMIEDATTAVCGARRELYALITNEMEGAI